MRHVLGEATAEHAGAMRPPGIVSLPIKLRKPALPEWTCPYPAVQYLQTYHEAKLTLSAIIHTECTSCAAMGTKIVNRCMSVPMHSWWLHRMAICSLVLLW